MVKNILIVCLLLTATLANAQLLNPSFEQRDSIGNNTYWNIEQGKVTRLTAVNFGVYPFTAFEGNNFVLLETDTLISPAKSAKFSQQFVLNDTPASIQLRYLFIPENNIQHATLNFFASKWNGNSRDTILFMIDSIPVVANGNNILIQWNLFAKDLKYLSTQIPDTATITFSNNNSNNGNNIKLFIDDITFGKWPVGIAENKALSAHFYPNPATDFITIEADQIQNLQLLSIDGKEWINQILNPTNYAVINIQYIPSGMYICKVKNKDGKQAHTLFSIQH